MDVTLSAIKDAWKTACQWRCQRRRHAWPNADVWHLRFFWSKLNEALFDVVQAGQYRLSPMEEVGRGGSRCVQWRAQDAFVLKWVAQLTAPLLTITSALYAHQGAWRARQAARVVYEATRGGDYRFVLCTDIGGYYQNIRKVQAKRHVRHYIKYPVLCDLMVQYVCYCIDDGGETHTPDDRVCRGCALSTLLGASLLHHNGLYFASLENVVYVHYMDDFYLRTNAVAPEEPNTAIVQVF